MPYVDGYVIAVPQARIEEYKAMARETCAVFMEHGAISATECVADDVPYGQITSFPRAVQAKDDEIVIFSWIAYPDKATRDSAMAKVMNDDRMMGIMQNAPFDTKRMIFGGFQSFLDLPA